MDEIAYLFSCNLQKRLKEVIFGHVFSRWFEDSDSLYISIESKNVVYTDRIENFTEKVLNGLSSQTVCDEVVVKFRRKVINEALYAHFIIKREELPSEIC